MKLNKKINIVMIIMKIKKIKIVYINKRFKI